MPADMIPANEAAALLHIKRPYLYTLIERGLLHPTEDRHPLQKKRSRLIFRRADVEQLAKTMTRRAVAQAS